MRNEFQLPVDPRHSDSHTHNQIHSHALVRDGQAPDRASVEICGARGVGQLAGTGRAFVPLAYAYLRRGQAADPASRVGAANRGGPTNRGVDVLDCVVRAGSMRGAGGRVGGEGPVLRATPIGPPRPPRRLGLSAHPPRPRGMGHTTPAVRAESLELATDLRRSGSPEALEVIVHRSGCLLPEDQALMDACYARGMRVTEIAKLRGVEARAIQRRIKRLSARVISPEFSFVLDQESTWPATRRRIARAVVLEGRTIQATSRALGLPIHSVRQHAQLIHALFIEHLVWLRKQADAQKRAQQQAREQERERERDRARKQARKQAQKQEQPIAGAAVSVPVEPSHSPSTTPSRVPSRFEPDAC